MNTQLDAVNVPGCATAESSRRDMAGPGRTVPPAPVARIVRIDVPSRRRQRRRKGVGLHTERSERAIRFTISPDRVTLVYGAVQVDRLVGSEPRRLTDIGGGHQMEYRHGFTCHWLRAGPARVVLNHILAVEIGWRPVN